MSFHMLQGTVANRIRVWDGSFRPSLANLLPFILCAGSGKSVRKLTGGNLCTVLPVRGSRKVGERNLRQQGELTDTISINSSLTALPALMSFIYTQRCDSGQSFRTECHRRPILLCAGPARYVDDPQDVNTSAAS